MSVTAICLLIGLPGVGKSTLAKLLKEKYHHSDLFQVIHIEFDELFNAEEQQHSPYWNEGVYKSARNKFYGIVKEVLLSKYEDSSAQLPTYTFLQGIDVKIKKNKVILLDDNFYYRSMRFQYYRLASEFSCGFCQIYIDCEMNLAIQRNKYRPISVAENVILDMSRKLEVPLELNHWESQSLTLHPQNFEESMSLILNLFSHNLKHTLHPSIDREDEIKKAQLECTRNLVHQSDLILRDLVANKIKHFLLENSKDRVKECSLALNRAKQEILGKIRTDNLCIPESVFQNGTIDKGVLKNFLELLFQRTASEQ